MQDHFVYSVILYRFLQPWFPWKEKGCWSMLVLKGGILAEIVLEAIAEFQSQSNMKRCEEEK